MLSNRPTVRVALVLVAYALLAVAFTWPLLTQFSTHTVSIDDNDNHELMWRMWWVQHALSTGQDVWHVPHVYWPHGMAFAAGETTPYHTLLLAPLVAAAGETVAYNVATLGSYLLAGGATFVLARGWLSGTASGAWRDALAALAGGLFAFSAYQVQKVHGGHVNLLPTGWLALGLLATAHFVEQPTPRRGALLGLAVALGALASWYYLLLPALLLPVYAFAAGLNAQQLRQPRFWGGVALAALIVAGLCGPFLGPLLTLARAGSTNVSAAERTFWAASPLDVVLPNPANPWFGGAVQALAWPLPVGMPLEFMTASVGPLTLGLAWVGWRRTHGPRWRGLKALTLLALVLSFGPVLHIGRLPTGLLMPAALLGALPGLDSLRTWLRFSVYVQLGAAVLAVAGLYALLEACVARARWGAWVGGCALSLLLLWPGLPRLSSSAPSTLDAVLAALPGTPVLAMIPPEAGLSGTALYHTRNHGQRVIYGAGTYFVQHFRAQHADVFTFPEDAAQQALRAWGVTHLVVDEAALRQAAYTLAQLDDLPTLMRIAAVDGAVIYTWADGEDTTR